VLSRTAVAVDQARPLRVCLVVPYDLADEGGVKRHVEHLAESLRQMGDEVTIAGPLRQGEAAVHTRGFGGVVNIPANGAANYMALLTPPWSVRRFFQDGDFDVVHVHEPLVPLLPYYALWFSPRAVHVCTFHMYAETETALSLTARRLLGQRLFPRFDRAIAVSQPAASYAGRAWTRTVSVIPNGVSTRTFRPAEAGPGPRPRPLRLLFVGNWRDGRKGLPVLLQAVSRLRARGVALHLDVIGDGGAEPPSLPGVTFHGKVSAETDLVRHYQDCDVFVSPALGQESFGIVLLEAMACGKPVVCSDIPGYRQVVDPGGACLVPPSDPEALVEAIMSLWGDPARRRAMGQANRRRAETFDWDSIATRVRGEYEAALRVSR
jgi:phosphatidylinositol alpha-mannosyltransferase